MSYFYALHVKTGMEFIITKKLNTLNKNANSSLFNLAFVPFKEIEIYDLENTTLEKKDTLVFNSYVFIHSEVKLDAQQYNLIKQCSPYIYRILLDEIPFVEIEAFFEDVMTQQTDLILQREHEERIKVLLENFSSVYKTLYNRRNSFKCYIQCIFKSKKIHLKLNRQSFLNVAKSTNITVKELITSPISFLEEVLKYYDCRITNTPVSFKI